MTKAIAIVHNALKNVYTIWFLFGIPVHTRLLGPVTELRKIVESHPSANDREIRIHWSSFATLLLGDWRYIRRVCALLSLANAGVMCKSYQVGDTLTTNLAAVSACFPIVTLAHVHCMEWHIRSLDQQPHPWIYWCKVTELRAQSVLKRTTVLLAAPLAGAVWSVVLCLILLSFAVLRLPIPTCLINSEAWPSDVALSHFVPVCRLQAEPIVINIHLLTTTRITLAAVLVVGAAHVAFNTYYFAMLGVPSNNDDEEASAINPRGTSSSVSYALPLLPPPSHQGVSRRRTRSIENRATSPTP